VRQSRHDVQSVGYLEGGQPVAAVGARSTAASALLSMIGVLVAGVPMVFALPVLAVREADPWRSG
jgi:hypothetical protein